MMRRDFFATLRIFTVTTECINYCPKYRSPIYRKLWHNGLSDIVQKNGLVVGGNLRWYSESLIKDKQWSNGCTKTTEKQACQISHVHFDGIAHLIEVTNNILFPWANAISADLFVDRVIIRDGSWQPSMLSGVSSVRVLMSHVTMCGLKSF